MAGDWIGINSSHIAGGEGVGFCEESGRKCEDAVNGVDSWAHLVAHTHWLILDLGVSRQVTKVRGRSLGSLDPTDVNIYVSDINHGGGNLWGVPNHANIDTWFNTDVWQEVVLDTPGTGRYVYFEIVGTELIGWLGFGRNAPTSFKIIDVYAETLGPGPYPVSSLKKGKRSGFHCFMSGFLSAKGAGFAPLKLPDGTPF